MIIVSQIYTAVLAIVKPATSCQNLSNAFDDRVCLSKGRNPAIKREYKRWQKEVLR
jgi:hypothetical protein